MSTTSQDLKNERLRASFPSRELTELLYGGLGAVEKRRRIERLVSNDPVLLSDDVYFLSEKERYVRSLQRNVRAEQVMQQHQLNKDPTALKTFYSFVHADEFPSGIHWFMFKEGFQGQANEEQQAKWMPLINKMKIIGTYAQTELGHGSFLRGLETTATYDVSSQEFILNSPTLTSIKWWPAGLGFTVTHAIVMAQLIINDRRFGPHLFLVQVRDLSTHQPCKGVQIGDIGPKMGFDAINNGFLKLGHIRIPRDQMLMKYAEVTPSGEFIPHGHSSKLVYGTMTLLRAEMVQDSAWTVSRAVTVAVRYSAVRRQGYIKESEREVQVLDYGSQQYQLLPLITLAHALIFTGLWMANLYANFTPSNPAELQEIHSTSACLKAISTQLASSAVDTCRLCCGGHGYSQSSSLPQLYAWMTPAETFEGENHVMWLQSARYLVKWAASVRQGRQLPPGVHYLKAWQGNTAPILDGDHLLSNVERLVDVFACCSARLLALAEQQLASFLSDCDGDNNVAWNRCHPWLVRAAKAHGEYLIVCHFADVLKQQLSASLHRVFQHEVLLYALWRIEQCSGVLLETNTVTRSALQACHSLVVDLLSLLRPEAVALVDAFDHPDIVLRSALGSYDGDVYRRLFDWAQKAPLNKKQVTDGYHKYIEPLIKAKL